MATSGTPSPSKSAAISSGETLAGKAKVPPNCCLTRDASCSALADVSAAGDGAGAGDCNGCGDCPAVKQVAKRKTMPMDFMSRVYCLLGRRCAELPGRIPLSNTLKALAALEPGKPHRYGGTGGQRRKQHNHYR